MRLHQSKSDISEMRTFNSFKHSLRINKPLKWAHSSSEKNKMKNSVNPPKIWRRLQQPKLGPSTSLSYPAVKWYGSKSMAFTFSTSFFVFRKEKLLFYGWKAYVSVSPRLFKQMTDRGMPINQGGRSFAFLSQNFPIFLRSLANNL